jgi:molybdate transport system regulatory protein
MKRAPLIRFRIDFSENANIGPGKIALLEAIRTYESMSEAARRMGISYRRAWLLLDSINKSFNVAATTHSVGGRGGGGATITPFGILLIERYREVEQKLNDIAGESLKEIKARVNHRYSPSVRRVPVTKKSRKST